MPGRRRYERREQGLMQLAAAVVGAAGAAQVIAPQAEDMRSLVERLDVHEALNTYEESGLPAGAYEIDLNTRAIVGANGRRLIIRRDHEGLWIGGCLISQEAHGDDGPVAYLTEILDGLR